MGMDERRDARATVANRVVVLAPLGRDAAVVCRTLSESGVSCAIADDIADLTAMVRRGAGAALLAEEALTAGGVAELGAALADQPSWSELPVLLLLAGGDRVVPEATRPAAIHQGHPSH